MKKSFVFIGTTVSSLLVTAAVAAPVYAWHPQGMIIKSVQNVTTKSVDSDANTEATAVLAKTGDVLTYTVVVANDGAAASNGNNDMAKTVMTDTLPAGVELVSNPAERTITENLGTVKPGAKVTKTYSVKVTSTTDGDVITNEACFNGNSTVNDNPQSGCDKAVVKVQIPKVPTPPTPPTTGGGETTPTTLVNTGAGSAIAPIAVLTALGSYLLGLRIAAKRRA